MKVSSISIPGLLATFFLLGSLTLTGCGQDNNTEEAATAEMETTAGNPTPGTAATGVANTAAEQPVVGTRPANVTPQAAQNPLTLGVSNVRVKSGEPLCLDIQVADFTQLLSMQYSLRWDPAALQFKSLQNFQLPGLGPEDFGTHRSAEGLLTAMWIDESLRGVTVNDGAGIYQICFQAVAPAGTTTEVSFVDGPTPFEVVNLKNELVDLKGVAGRVSVN